MKEQERMLQDAVAEIKSLRNQNQLMAARLDVFDKCMMLLHTPPRYHTEGMAPDLVFEIEKHLADQKANITDNK